MKRNNKKGFTIVELVIVIAVIAILAAVLIPTFSNIINNANESAAMQSARIAYTNFMVEDEYLNAAEKDFVIAVDTSDAKGYEAFFAVKDGQFDPTEYKTANDAAVAAAGTGYTCEKTAINTGDLEGGVVYKVVASGENA